MVCRPDPAAEVVDAFVAAMLDVFRPDQPCPPDGGGSTDVRFFAGDANSVWPYIPHSEGAGCDGPLLWVRAMHRFRSMGSQFPAAYLNDAKCGAQGVLPVLAVEIGVGRCASTDADPSWDALATAAEISLDDSWRIETALCAGAARLRTTAGRLVAVDSVNPYGPEGGIVAWTGVAYAQF